MKKFLPRRFCNIEESKIIKIHFFSEWTKEELQAIFDKRCKPEPVEPCSNTTFGCCPDGFNAAVGPFHKDCPEYKTCEDTKYGCCMDGATMAQGMRFDGCPPSKCEDTL